MKEEHEDKTNLFKKNDLAKESVIVFSLKHC